MKKKGKREKKRNGNGKRGKIKTRSANKKIKRKKIRKTRNGRKTTQRRK